MTQIFNAAFASGNSGDLAGAMAHAGNAMTTADLGTTLDALHPGGHAASGQAMSESTGHATTNLLSCGERDGPFAAIREGECVWSKGYARRLTHDGSFVTRAFEDRSYGFGSGVQVAVAEHWRLGASLGFEEAQIASGADYHSDETSVHVGVAAKYTNGPWLLALTPPSHPSRDREKPRRCSPASQPASRSSTWRIAS